MARWWDWSDIMAVELRHVVGREEKNGEVSEYNELSERYLN